MSAPLVAGDRSLGALKVYARRPGAFDRHAEHLLVMFAAQAAILLANVQSVEIARRLSDGLKDALRSRDLIATAKGILMAREGVAEEPAFAVLVAGAQREHKTLRDAATAWSAPPFAAAVDGPSCPASTSTSSAAPWTSGIGGQADPRAAVGAYFALGGVAGLVEVEAYLNGVTSLPSLQRDVLAHAVNERLDELTWRHRVPYSRRGARRTDRSRGRWPRCWPSWRACAWRRPSGSRWPPRPPVGLSACRP